MSDHKDYNLTYQRIIDGNGAKKLRVILNSIEFGPMQTEDVLEVADEAINKRLQDSMADDLIDSYEKKLADRSVAVFMGGFGGL